MINKDTQKIKRIELPICTTPEVRTYSYYALPQCIIMAEERIGKRIAEFEICETDNDTWTSIGMKKEGMHWKYETEDKYNRFCNGCIYRPLSDNEGYVHIKVNFQQESEPWAAVNVFLTDDEENVLLGDNEYICRFGNFIHDGVSLYYSGKKEQMKERLDGKQGDFVLSLSNGKIECFFGIGKQIKKIGEKQINTTKKLYIGVQVRHEENSFYPWLFSNFIQIKCNLDSEHRRLEFYNFYKKEQFDLPNHFLDYNYIKVSDMLHYGGVKALKWELEQKRYIEIKLDQYYLFGRDEYHYAHHLHQNLIYGFDDKQKVFMTVGYDNSGKIQRYNVSYRDINETLKRNKSHIIKIITYCQGFRFYRFMPEYIQRICKDYLEEKNTELLMQAFLPTEKTVQGIGIYRELCTQKGINLLIADRRISYLLYEHKVIMEKRIEYMWEEKLINEELYKKIKLFSETARTTAFNLVHLMQKYRFRPDKREDGLIKHMISEMEENDKKLMYALVYEWEIDEKESRDA